MKSILTKFAFIFLFFSCNSKKEFTTEFYVRGNCEMCKERIENAAYQTKGVSFADWNEETSKLSIKIDTSSSSIASLHQKIAETGHSTSLCKKSQKAHDELPECCKE